MLKCLSLALLFLLMGFKNPNEKDLLAVSYVNKYSELAVAEMYRSGIPASITLAQGLHESNFGQSRLAKEANNHFGIKCKSYWVGNTFYHKDDDLDDKGKLIDSCFRAYLDDISSYIDHTNFLKQSTNYISLFQYSHIDYPNWAKGLKESGYATDPLYAEKLVSLIERFKLYNYDHYPNPLSN